MNYYQKIRRSGVLLLAFCAVSALVWAGRSLPPGFYGAAPVGTALQGEAAPQEGAAPQEEAATTIKRVDFDVPYDAMKKALDADLRSHEEGGSLRWIDLLAMLGTRYGGNWKQYRQKDMNSLIESLSEGKTPEELMANNKYYSYYQEAYTAILSSFVGQHQREMPNKLTEGEKLLTDKYGLKVFSPIAEGFGFSHYDDFGNARSYGYRRTHLGHDLMGAVGTPICAVEGGIVEDLGWNRFGGWRVGIRSLDGKRYYYYAHMRKDAPYHIDMEKGRLVRAGEVIGYLGMTGYSSTENINNMQRPHLHFRMQIIFDPSQKEGPGEIWIDTYQIVRLLEQSRSTVERDSETKQYYKTYRLLDPEVEDYLKAHPESRR